MDENRIKEVFSDEAFVKSLLELETPEDVQKALKGKDIEVGVEEILQLRDALLKAAEMAQSGGELSVEDLDEAAGGFIPIITFTTMLAPQIISMYVTSKIRW